MDEFINELDDFQKDGLIKFLLQAAEEVGEIKLYNDGQYHFINGGKLLDEI